MKQTFALVEVLWLDATTHVGWHQPSDPFPLSQVKTVGYLLGEDDAVVRLAGSLQEDCVGDVTVIPRSQIQSREVLKARDV